MNDSIASISALFTVVAILFGLWYSEINKSTEIHLSIHGEDNKSLIKKIRNVRNSKGIPLLIINLLLGLIFIPDAFYLIIDFFAFLKTGVKYKYDSSKLAFLIILLLSFSLDFLLIGDLHKINKKLKKYYK